MRSLKYVVYREGKYFVSQCLNVDVASFGKSIDEAVANLKENSTPRGSCSRVSCSHLVY